MAMKNLQTAVKEMKPESIITMYDSVDLSSSLYISPNDKIEHLDTSDVDRKFEAAASKIKAMMGKKSAIVAKADATHYGFVNKNNFFYNIDFIRVNAGTWIEKLKDGKSYGRTVQVDHNTDSDSTIGRVMSATPVIYDTKSDNINTPDGHIGLIYYVSDKEAIEKIIDGRFRTLSVGASSNRDNVKCSICGRSVADSECEHMKGKEYVNDESGKKELCYWIWDRKFYKEVSYVTTPADALAQHTEVKLINIDGQDINDAVKTKTKSNDIIIPKISLMIGEIKDSCIGKLVDVNGEVISYDSIVTADSINSDTMTFTTKQKKDTNDKNDKGLSVDCGCLDTQEKDNTNDNINLSMSQRSIVDATLSLVIEMIQSDSININDAITLLFDECNIYISMSDRSKDKVLELLDQELINRDAKLSTERRNKLNSSQFCGPNRSFPIPDCAHVTAARRLIGRYKGSESTKARIMACVNRKAKALGCDKSQSKDNTNKEESTMAKFQFDSVEELLQSPSVQKALDELKTSSEQAIDNIKSDAQKKESTFKKIAIDTIIDLYKKLGKSQVTALADKEGEEKDKALKSIEDKLAVRSLDTLVCMLEDLRSEESYINTNKKEESKSGDSASTNESQAAIDKANAASLEKEKKTDETSTDKTSKEGETSAEDKKSAEAKKEDETSLKAKEENNQHSSTDENNSDNDLFGDITRKFN